MVTSLHALIVCIQIGQSKPAEVHAFEEGHQPAQKVQDNLFVEASLPQHRQASRMSCSNCAKQVDKAKNAVAP